MKLITETIENIEVLTEERNGKKDYKIKGIFMQADIKNRNGRVYPKEILMREAKKYSENFLSAITLSSSLRRETYTGSLWRFFLIRPSFEASISAWSAVLPSGIV